MTIPGTSPLLANFVYDLLQNNYSNDNPFNWSEYNQNSLEWGNYNLWNTSQMLSNLWYILQIALDFLGPHKVNSGVHLKSTG